jgi:hypothetical protein
MTRQKTPARRCSWHHCSAPATTTVAFQLPNLLAGSHRDYCREHTRQVRQAKGTVVVAHLGARRPPALANSADATGGRRTDRIVSVRRKGVVP